MAQLQPYYAEGRYVFARPKKTATGTSMGFLVCEVPDHGSAAENAAEIARCLNQDDAIDRSCQGSGLQFQRGDEPLGVCITSDRLIVAMGTEPLIHAVSDQPALADYNVTDPAAFAAAIVKELRREQGDDGTTLLHIALDQAAVNAMENGAEGIRHCGPEWRDGDDEEGQAHG